MTDWLIEAARRPIAENPLCCQPEYCRANFPHDYANPDACKDCQREKAACTCQGGYHQPQGVQLRANDCPIHGEELPEGMIMRDGSPHVRCNVCHQWYEWPIEIEEFAAEEYQYCGSSPRCCP